MFIMKSMAGTQLRNQITFMKNVNNGKCLDKKNIQKWKKKMTNKDIESFRTEYTPIEYAIKFDDDENSYLTLHY